MSGDWTGGEAGGFHQVPEETQTDRCRSGQLGRFPRRNSNPRPRQTMSLISLDFSLVLNPGVLAGAQRQEEVVRRKAEETGPQCLQGSPP